jgi:hypothetical protein
MQQYRVTVNDSVGKIVDSLPSEQWTHATDVVEDRGGIATLERRFIFAADYVAEWAADPSQFIQLKDKCISKWEVFAQVEAR